MKIVPAVIVLVLQAGLAAPQSLRPAQSPAPTIGHAAAQNPLAGLEEAVKEKAAEEALTKVLNDNLPLTLNAKDVYPTVATLPGGPFNPTPLKLTSADQLNQPLAPGDYTINTLDFCSEYSVHQPGAGTAYVLGPYEGKAAGAIGALIWRGTEQYGIAPQSLQAVSWAIQSGLTYDQMPKSYQAIVDQVIPDLKNQITGDMVTNLENTYNSLAQSAKLPPLDTILAKLGEPGQLALDAEKERQILTAQNTSDELKQQTLFQGQESGIYTPVSAESGPWTERVQGQVYMKLLIAGGNMNSNNVMQIRVMPPPTANARMQAGGPHLVRAAFGEPQVTPAASNTPITLTSIIQGILGYPVGKGAQALGQVVAALLKAVIMAPTPAEAATATPPATQSQPVPTPSATATAQTTPTPLAQSAQPAASTAQAANPNQTKFRFTSCSGAMTSLQLYSAYNSLYSGSSTFKTRTDLIKNRVHVLAVDGLNSALGTYYQPTATNAYCSILLTHPNSGFKIPPSGDYAFTQIPSKKAGDDIWVIISAQNLLYNEYDSHYDPVPRFSEGKCGITVGPTRQVVSVQQVLAYELAENAVGLSGSPSYPEEPDETETNTIMGELANAHNIVYPKDIIPDQGNCKIMSGAAYCSDGRKCAVGSATGCDNKPCTATASQGAVGSAPANEKVNGILDFAGQSGFAISANPSEAPVFDETGTQVGNMDCNKVPKNKQTMPACDALKKSLAPASQ